MSPRGPKPGTPQAKRGGTATLSIYGPDHFATIGSKGGVAFRDRYGTAGYQSIGKAGGQNTLANHGTDFFREIARKGVLAAAANHWARLRPRYVRAFISLGACSAATGVPVVEVQKAVNQDGGEPISDVALVRTHLHRLPGFETDGKKGRGVVARWWLVPETPDL